MKIPVNVKRTSQLLIASSLILASLPLLAQEQPTPEPPKAVDLTWGVKIPMRDGVKLNATVYRPKDQKEKLPVIFELTPYISDNYHGRAYYFAQHGYVFALVDVRGRGNSAGHFDPFQQEPQDGHDVVEWLATQPWSNGKVDHVGWFLRRLRPVADVAGVSSLILPPLCRPRRRTRAWISPCSRASGLRMTCSGSRLPAE